MQASYTYLSDDEWRERTAAFERLARRCALCPRRCGVDRLAGERGFCGAPGELVISSLFPHHGEEPPISGTRGSGTVFFTYCTLKCAFCQNWQLSHKGEGRPYGTEEFAHKLLALQQRGCHNINLVTATHFLPWILPALHRAARQGLRLPLVYNCGGYEREEVVDLLEGIVDVWLPDMKYGDDRPAARYSRALDYVAVNRAAVRRMFRQVGPLRLDGEGIARRGLILRHLVLPGNRAASDQVLSFLADVFDPEDLTVSWMAQYRPLYRAGEYPELAGRLDPAEYAQSCRTLLQAGFAGFLQDAERLDEAFVIDFQSRKEEALTGQPETGPPSSTRRAKGAAHEVDTMGQLPDRARGRSALDRLHDASAAAFLAGSPGSRG